MLVLSRKKNESVVIGDNEIKLVVVEIRGDKVRLGIEAPADIPVHRREVYEAIVRDGGDRSTRRKRPLEQVRERLSSLLEQHSPASETGSMLLDLLELAGGPHAD